jgi:hypothetical protein
LPCYPDKVRVGIVAHEFAHAVCDHGPESVDPECEADRVAEGWGFGEEIKAMRAYIQSHSGGGER